MKTKKPIKKVQKATKAEQNEAFEALNKMLDRWHSEPLFKAPRSRAREVKP